MNFSVGVVGRDEARTEDEADCVISFIEKQQKLNENLPNEGEHSLLKCRQYVNRKRHFSRKEEEKRQHRTENKGKGEMKRCLKTAVRF